MMNGQLAGVRKLVWGNLRKYDTRDPSDPVCKAISNQPAFFNSLPSTQHKEPNLVRQLKDDDLSNPLYDFWL